jgi:hypothetical protein
MHEIDESNPVRIDVTSLDWDDALEAPTTLQYRIDNLTDVIAAVPWTTIPTPTTTSVLTIAASVNGMYTNWRDQQLMQVTFLATYADGTQCQKTGIYQINRLYQGA